MGILVIEKQDLKHNIKQIKEYAKRVNDKLKIIAIVKSNGYRFRRVCQFFNR